MGQTTTVRQTSFSIGEVDITNYKRTDFKDYLNAAQSLINIEVGSTGLAKKRKGTAAELLVNGYAEERSSGYEFIDKYGNFYIIISANVNFHVFSVIADVVSFYQTVTTPYTSDDLINLDYAEVNDSIIFSIGNRKPGRIFISTYGPAVFSFELLNIYPYPAVDFGKINYDNFTVMLSGNTTTITFVFTGLTSDPGFTTAWIGGQILGGGETPEEPVGYAIITNVIPWNGSQVTFTGNVQEPFQISGASTQGSDYSIKQPAWSDDLGWPAKVCFYQNRLWLANSQSLPSNVFGSQINAPINYDIGTGADTDAIIYSIGQTNTGGITWLNPGKQLEIYSRNFDFVAPQDTNSALTPSTFTIRQQDAYGSSNSFKPINYINDSYYVGKTGNSFINYKFDGVGQSYTATNISVAASHLIRQPINRALLRGTDSSQDNFVYMLNNDKTLTCFQFAQQVGLAAFSPIQFQLDESDELLIEVLDVFTIDNDIYLLKRYTVNDNYVLERFVEDVKMDSYINSTMNSLGLVTGLDNLDGYEVVVMFQGQDMGQYLVNDGQVLVFNPNLFTGSVQVGLLYPVKIETMYLFDGVNKSSWIKGISQINVDYYNSINFYVNNTLVPYQTYYDIQHQLPPQPQTGTATIRPVGGWNMFETITITQNSPFDLQILGISYQINAYSVS